ncbi:hypothetical protein V1525DRAFT_339725 [Lipomyces kononenkoae]|uniref:Uncharacterized protein n=1 Tax=Lipomyces kononenkoae TaxID=34357 RepID=A0ACC3T5I5_LIPKO
MKCIKQIASSLDKQDQSNLLTQLQNDYPSEPVGYFLTQWWSNGQCERWAEVHIRNHPNLGISSTSRVEGSHGAMKGGLTSSSGNLSTAGNKINHRERARIEQLSVLSSNENLRVRLEIRNQTETSKLCSAITRPALERVYEEVMKKVNNQEEAGTRYQCTCETLHRYMLPCSHRIELGTSLEVHDIHPRWRVDSELPPLGSTLQHHDFDTRSVLKDPPIELPRKGRPKGTRRLKTSAEIIQKAADRIDKIRRCGTCQRVGHNRRTCPRLQSNMSPANENNRNEGMADEQPTSEQLADKGDDSLEGVAKHDDDDHDNGGEDHEDEGHDDDAAFEAMWADALSLL